MNDIAAMIAQLVNKDQNTAYAAFLRLREASRQTDSVYPYFDYFAKMLESGSSYVRTRGLLLIAANAEWDANNKIDKLIDAYLAHIMDAKPTVSRQLIAALPELAAQKPKLAEDILSALHRANPGRYGSSMAPLIQKDIAAALEQISSAALPE